MSITVACVLVRGNVPYTTEYVKRLRSMVARRMSVPHDFVVLTDEPANFREIPQVRAMKIPSCGSLPGWWSKIHHFDPKHYPIGHRVVALDLDVLITDSMDAIVGYPTTFALAPHAGNFQGRGNLKVIKNFNSSVMVWTVSEKTSELFTKWTPKVAERLWGDQDWIGEQFPSADKMPLEWFPRLSEIKDLPLPPKTKVVLCKRPKNHEAVKTYPWFAELWQ